MKIYFMGHASFLVQTEETNLLIDPWFSNTGAFLRSWYQFPKNHHMLDFAISQFKLRTKNYIYVTHEHEDHFDVKTLKALSEHCNKLLIPNYKNKKLYDAAVNLGFANISCLDEEGNNVIGDLKVNIFIQETAINNDSAILVENSNNYKFLNLNDCKIHDRIDHVLSKYGKIDVLTQQYSGASMHPVTYDYNSNEYKKISLKKRKSKMQGVVNVVKTLEPKIFIPSAGPPVFLREDLFNLNFEEHSTFPMFWQFQEYFQKRISSCKFVPLDVQGYIDLQNQQFFNVIKKLTPDELKLALVGYRQDFVEYPFQECKENVFLKLYKNLKRKVAVLKSYNSLQINEDDIHYIYFTPDHKKYIKTDIVNASISITDRIDNDSFYCHTYEDFFIGKVLVKKCSWSSYFLSFMFKNKRTPNKYNTTIEAFLISDDEKDFKSSLEEIAKLKHNKVKIELHDKESGKTYECSRYCPHQGADLKYALIKNGKVICPRHGWEFDLENKGQCHLNNFTLDSKILK